MLDRESEAEVLEQTNPHSYRVVTLEGVYRKTRIALCPLPPLVENGEGSQSEPAIQDQGTLHNEASAQQHLDQDGKVLCLIASIQAGPRLLEGGDVYRLLSGPVLLIEDTVTIRTGIYGGGGGGREGGEEDGEGHRMEGGGDDDLTSLLLNTHTFFRLALLSQGGLYVAQAV